MKKLVVLIVLLICSLNSGAQSKELKKNTISYEFGIWQRGLVGISYHRNMSINEKTSVSIGGSFGAGIGWESDSWFGSFERNLFAGGDFSLNMGENGVHFMLGAEAKYIELYAIDRYEGLGAIPYAGVSTDISGFTFQLRGGALLFGSKMNNVLPSFGVSFGYSF